MDLVPKFHNIRLGKNTLRRPARELAAVVLHFGSHDRTSLTCELGSPVQRAPATLRLMVEFVECLDRQELIFAANVILNHSIDLGTDNQVQWILILFEREVEPPILVGFGG